MSSWFEWDVGAGGRRWIRWQEQLLKGVCGLSGEGADVIVQNSSSNCLYFPQHASTRKSGVSQK